MNTPEYRKAYMANLKTEASNNKKNLVANKSNPAAQQCMQNTGQCILGVPTFRGETNVQGKGTKYKGGK